MVSIFFLGFHFKVELSWLIGFKSRWRFVICDLKSWRNDIRSPLNAHISQSINVFDVIQIESDSLFKELPNDRSYSQFHWETRKLWLFYEALSNGNRPIGSGDICMIGCHLFDRAPLANYNQAYNARSGLKHIDQFEFDDRLTRSGDGDFDAGCMISFQVLCELYPRVY